MWSAISRSLSQFASARRHQSRRRLSLERLEGRSLLSTVHLTVNTLADDPSGPVAGQTTLRDAITAADSGSTTDKYVIKFAVDGTIALTAPLPDLTGNIDIKGPGAANLTISAADLVNPSIGADNSIFIVNNNATAEINGLTLSDAQSGPPNGGSPGAIGNYGIVLIKNCVFSGNGGNGGIQETATNGGGLFNAQTATATIQNSTFINDIRTTEEQSVIGEHSPCAAAPFLMITQMLEALS